MKKVLLSFLWLIVMSLSISANAQITPFMQGRLQFALDSVCNRFQIKGASAAVLIPNLGIWKGAYGMAYANKPIQPDMLMGMGSNTKTHFAATLLKMQEQGLLSLNDTIGKWIRGYPTINGKATIRQCLNHTSGFYDYMHNATINDSILGKPGKQWAIDELLSLVKAPHFTPGNGWRYSNTNYIIAGIIIREVMQQSPYQVLQQLILQPNGLNHTFDFKDIPSNLTFANPWSVVETGDNLTDMTTVPYLNQLFSLASTAGSLLTSAEDNVQFWYKLIKGNMLSQSSLNELTQFVTYAAGQGYGLGLFRLNNAINGKTVYSHGGTFFGYINENIIDINSGLTISVLTNQDSISNNTLLLNLIPALHKELMNMPATGFTEHQKAGAIKLYPNPATEQVSITFSNESEVSELTLSDLSGKVWIKQINGSGILQLEGIPQGIYILKATDKELNLYQQKLVVQ